MTDNKLMIDVSNRLLQERELKPYDFIDVSYANARLDELNNDEQITLQGGGGICPTLKTRCNNYGMVVEDSMSEKEYEVCDFRYDEGLRSRVETQVVPTLTTHSGMGVSGTAMIMENESVDKVIEDILNVPKNLRIRKLTPRECWRLMGFSERREDGTWDDTAFENASKVNSNAQLYKQAGNSIVVDCLAAIFQNLFLEPDHTEYREISLF